MTAKAFLPGCASKARTIYERGVLREKGAGDRKKRAGFGLALLLALAAAPLAAAPARNLVLITLDTTRADHLGAWGWPHARTPNLDALAARGTRFARCDTAAPITLPSHATILTGLYPPRHGVRDNGTFVLSPRIETVAERLAARGYDTAAVVSAVVLARRHGLDQGFRLYDDDLEAGYAAGTEVAERTAEATTAAALAASGKLRAPFFLWVHYFDPHDEYRPPSRFADRATGPNRLYDGEIAYMDEQIGRLLAGLPKDVTVAVVGDHGEMLGEHGEEHHGLLLHHGARRVPLLLAGPGVPSGKTVDCLVRTADLAPTLLALAGAPVPEGLDGRGLLPLPTRCDRTSYSESFLPFFAYKWYPPRALSTDRTLYIRWPKGTFYDLATDPDESKDLAPRQPQTAKALDQRLTDLLGRMGERPEPEIRPAAPLSEEERKALASLGYAGGGPGGTVAPSLPDPRSMLEVAVGLHRASEAVQQGKCAQALPDLQSIVKRDPHNVPALSLAGFCLEKAGRLDSALNAYRLAARERPDDASPAVSAGSVLLKLGRHDEAEKELRRALGLDPAHADAAARLAELLRRRGRRDEAVAVLDAALAAGSRTPGVYLERALARAESGRVADALNDFREASRRAPTDPVPLEGAARAAYQLGRHREAAQLYEQLLRLQPGRLDLWKTAGAIYYYELQDHPGALRCFRRALSLEPDPAERARLEELIRELQG